MLNTRMDFSATSFNDEILMNSVCVGIEFLELLLKVSLLRAFRLQLRSYFIDVRVENLPSI